MNLIVDLVVSLIVLFCIVLLHEFGHWLAAWILKFPVTAVCIGVGPRVFTVGKLTFRAIPIGGYVECEAFLLDTSSNADLIKRLVIIAAGPTMTLINLLAYLYLRSDVPILLRDTVDIVLTFSLAANLMPFSFSFSFSSNNRGTKSVTDGGQILLLVHWLQENHRLQKNHRQRGMVSKMSFESLFKASAVPLTFKHVLITQFAVGFAVAMLTDIFSISLSYLQKGFVYGLLWSATILWLGRRRYQKAVNG